MSDIDIAIIVVCAGFKRADWFKQITGADLQRMLDLNVYHYFAMLKTFFPILSSREHKSALVIVSSMNDRIVVPVNITYGATKVFSSYLGYAL